MATSEMPQKKRKIVDEEKTEDFHKQRPGSDITFVMDDKERVYASKAVLTIASPVFEAMFKSDFKEKEANEIPLPGKKSKDIVALMDVIHPNTLADITEYTIEPLLKLAREYQMKQLTKKCEKFLLECNPSFHYLSLAEEYNVEEAIDKNMNFAHSIPLNMLDKYPEFKEISKECTDEIIFEKGKMRKGLETETRTDLMNRKTYAPETYAPGYFFSDAELFAEIKVRDQYGLLDVSDKEKTDIIWKRLLGISYSNLKKYGLETLSRELQDKILMKKFNEKN